MLLLTSKDIKNVFKMKDAIEADKQAFRIYSERGTIAPLRVHIEIPKYQGQTIFMPCYVDDLDSAGVKIVSAFPRNMEKGKANVPATMILIDGTSGEVCCILDGTYFTRMRTGAAAGAATDLLARSDSRIGALIGTGGQAATHLEAMLTVRDLEEVRIFSRNLERAGYFVEKMQAELAGFSTTLRLAGSSDEAVADADIITAVTTSPKPVFDGRLVKAGAHINGMGSYRPDMQELDECIIQRADKIFFDSQEAVLAESGDFIIPIKNGTVIKEKLTGDIGKLIDGALKGRETAEEITIFKSVGMAAMDVVTASQIYQKARKQGIGQEFFF